MKKIMLLLLIGVLQGCGGSTDSNVDAQKFVDDFMWTSVIFFTEDCHVFVSVKTSTDQYFINNRGFQSEQHGVQRDLLTNGIEYHNDNFSLIKYLSGRIVLEYENETCEIPQQNNNLTKG